MILRNRVRTKVFDGSGTSASLSTPGYHVTLHVTSCRNLTFAKVPQLEAIISKTWGKEDELKQLKSELAALDRKITAELAPKHDENDGIENKQEHSQQSQTAVKSETVVNTVNVHTTDSPQGHKPSMVAEPQPRYPMTASATRFLARHSGI